MRTITKALDEHEAAVQAVADAQARIDEANAQIAELQDKLSKRARSMYRSGQTTALDVILGATTFEEFATSWDLLNDINDNDAAMVQQTKDLRAEVEAAKIELEKQERIAAEKAEEAARIKAEAEQTIQTLEATLQQLDAEAQALLVQEQEAARAAEAAAAAAEVKRTYAYSTPSASIPSQGSVVDYALSRIGCPYVWGAAGPNEFDCSGLVTWAYAQVGISVPHQTESMYYAAAARLPVSEAQPGDVLWISYGDGYNGHAGIRLQCRGHALRSRPHVWRARARYRSAELGRVYACAPIRIRRENPSDHAVCERVHARRGIAHARAVPRIPGALRRRRGG
mgnify:CR=1 FL=1